MTRLYFDHCLLPDGWAKSVSIDVDAGGQISAVTCDAKPEDVDFSGAIALPGVPNCHSHAFQRAMAGLTEKRGPNADNGHDSFWTWRDLMYRFVDRITPEDLLAIASLAYVEMLEAGFTSVAEFHYVHHTVNRRPFDNIAEMSLAIIQAARETGLGLTLLPVFYESSGFGGAEVGEAQARFANTPDMFGKLVESAKKAAQDLPDAVVGIAPHSLRAVTPDGLAEILNLSDGPIHIHIAEQQREVDDCIAWSGARPVEWLFDHAPVDDRWCLVHATHLTQTELTGLADSRAVAGLCPITEANLGDGIFAAGRFLEQGGRLAIGSDSNVLISVAEELRLLEYGQRLRDQGRNRLAISKGSTGRNLVDQVLAGGAQVSGRVIGKIEPGYRADIISLDQNHASLVARNEDAWLDGWIFAGDNDCVQDVWVGGQHLVRQGQHIAREMTLKSYANVLKKLVDF
jgi:formimidoylglutamate deiminase